MKNPLNNRQIYLWIATLLIVVVFCYWSGLIGAVFSDHKMYPIYWSTYVSDETERIKIQGYWLTEITDNHYKLKSILWIPNSDNAGGFLEVGYYERKAHWWEIW